MGFRWVRKAGGLHGQQRVCTDLCVPSCVQVRFSDADGGSILVDCEFTKHSTSAETHPVARHSACLVRYSLTESASH